MSSYASVRLAIVAIGIAATPASTGATLIDFESLPGGAMPTSGAEVLAAYASLGVTIGTLDPGSDALTPTFQHNRVITGGPGGSSQSIPGWSIVDSFRSPGFADPLNAFHILAVFSTPASRVAADAYAAFGVGLTMRAYDEDGALLATVTAPADPDDIFKGNLEIAGVGEIVSVVWTASSPFGAGPMIDDLEFDPVPEPGAFVLLAGGLAGLSAGRKSNHPTTTSLLSDDRRPS